MRRNARVQPVLLVILLVGYTLRVWQLAALPLIGDEAYYWRWSRQLAWAYYDHPAGVALLVKASTALGGEGVFGIRWLNATLGVLCIALTYAVGRRLFSWEAGRYAAFLVALGAPFILLGRLVYTDTLFLLLMLLNLWIFVDIMLRDASAFTPRRALAFGLTLAALLNTKYSAYLYAVGLGGVILLEERWLLRRPWFWTSVVLAALGLLPVFGWNAAHNWDSFRWQLTHLVTTSPGDALDASGLPGHVVRNAHHAWRYLTGPVILAILPGWMALRRSRARGVALIAFVTLTPVFLSPANSPRNLTAAWTLLLLLAGQGLADGAAALRQRPHARALGALLTAGLLIAVAVYGVGTTLAFADLDLLPQSSLVADARCDAAGGPTLRAALLPYPDPLFALDYSLAAQGSYYTQRPVFTAWGQYRHWGIPPLDQATLIGWHYLPAPCVTAQLRACYAEVRGPDLLPIAGADKTLYVWQVAGARLEGAALLDRLDFLTLLERCR